MLIYLYLFIFSSALLLLSKLTFKDRHHSTYGPPSYPVLGCLISFYRNRHRLLDWYTELLSKSSTLTILIHRLGAPRTIVTANPHNVEYILKTNFNNYPKGQPFTETLGDFLGLGIFNVDGELWSAQRKLASHEFTAKSLTNFVVNTLKEEVQSRLFSSLEKAANEGLVFDLQDLLKTFAFDVIYKVTMGADPCCLDLSRPAPPLVDAFDKASMISAMRGAVPIVAIWKIKRALNVGYEKELKHHVKVVHDNIDEIIQTKKKEDMLKTAYDKDSRNDLLSILLCSSHDDEVVRDMVISFLLAGRDTTSSALTWFFWLLTRHRDVEKKVLDEVEVIMKGEKALSYEDLKVMSYTQACLCESMRLYPPVAWDSKYAENDDVLPDETRVYKGNRVTYFQYGMGRMEELWGKDKLEFKPDRWFDPSGAMKMVSPYTYPVFQAGPRVCLGKEMAFIEMKYVVASILSRFELMPENAAKQPVFVPLLTAHMAGGFKVRVRPRTPRM